MHHGSLTKAVAKGLTELKRRILEANIPPSKLDESLNIATWNIREFGKKPRSESSLHYIAEILGQDKPGWHPRLVRLDGRTRSRSRHSRWQTSRHR